MKKHTIYIPIIVLVVGIILSCIFQYVSYRNKLESKQIEINNEILQIHQSFRQELASSFSSMEIIRFFVESKADITRQDFQAFSKPFFLQFPSFKAISWVPSIKAGDRAHFENDMQANLSLKDFSIKSLSRSNKFVKSPTRKLYFPVKYIEPQQDNFNALGYDLLSDKIRKETIITALNTNRIVITPGIKLVQDSLGYGFLSILPVFEHSTYTYNHNQKRVLGLITIVFKVDLLVDKVISKYESKNINLFIYDITKSRQLLYSNINIFVANKEVITKKISVADRIWELCYVVNPNVYKVSNSFIVFFIGLTITFVSFLILLIPFFKKKRIDSTEREFFKESLNESEERLRMTMEVTQTAIWDWDLIEDKWYASPMYYTMLGYKPEIDNDRTVWIERLHPDDRDLVKAKINDLLHNRAEKYIYEARLKHADGTYRWVRVMGYIVENDDKGKVKRMLGTRTDITEGKLAELKLRESEEQFRVLFRESSSVMLLINADNGEIVDANYSACHFYGYSLKDLTNLTVFELNAFTFDVVNEVFEKAKLNGKIRYDFEHRMSDGSTKPVEVFSNKLILNGREMLYSIVHDRTERIMLEKEVELSVKELKMINNAITVCNHQQDLKQLFDSILGQSLEVLGLDAGNLCALDEDNTLRLISHINSSDKIIDKLKNRKTKIGECLCGDCALSCKPLILTNRAEVLTLSNKVIHCDEDIRYHASFPILLNSKCLGVVCVYAYSDFKPEQRALDLIEVILSQVAVAVENLKLYEKLNLYNKELEIAIHKRTKQLESSNKELEAFSYSVSHDLRAPLRHINGYIDLIFRRLPETFDEKGKHYLQNISASATQMSELIDGLLQFSRTGRQKINYTKVKMNLLVNEVVDIFKQDNKKRNIEWKVGDLAEVSGDLTLLKQVWINLLSNAVKFTQKKELARIEINCNETESEFVFSVSDNGAGFDMQYSAKLFGVFQRLHSSTDFEGTGIGLANVNSIIQRHGGRVWAEAEPNKGATFYFSLLKDVVNAK